MLGSQQHQKILASCSQPRPVADNALRVPNAPTLCSSSPSFSACNVGLQPPIQLLSHPACQGRRTTLPRHLHDLAPHQVGAMATRCGLTDVGAKDSAGLLGELPALTHLDLSCNDLSAQRKGAITRACRKRPSTVACRPRMSTRAGINPNRLDRKMGLVLNQSQRDIG